MAQLVCRFNDKFHCSFEVSPFLSSLANGTTAGSLAITSVGFLSVFILWILIFVIRHVDHARAYITTLLIPTTIFTFLNWLQVLLKFTHEHIYTFDGVEDGIIALFILIADCQYLIGTIASLLFNIATACNRNEAGPVVTWITFLLTLVLSAGFSTASLFLNLSVNLLPVTLFVFFIGCVILACLIPFIACGCSAPKKGQSLSPVVANAKSRMIWSLIFAIPVVLLVMAKYFVDFSYIGEKTETINKARILLYVLMGYIQPILLLLSAVLFLPAYRSALCCNQGPANGEKPHKKGTICPSEAQPTPGDNQQQIPTKPANTTQQVSSNQATQGQMDPNLVALLTNPSLMSTMNLQNRNPVPNQDLTVNSAPNCNHLPYAQMAKSMQNLQEPMTMLQVPKVPDGPEWAIAVPQQNVIVTQPTSMVHYASQPNLVQYVNAQQQITNVPHLIPVQGSHNI